MTRSTSRNLALGLLLALLAQAAGCGSTYRDFMNAKAGFNETVGALADLKEAGYIEPGSALDKRITTLIDEGRAAMGVLAEKFIRDEQILWTDVWAVFTDIGIKLAQEQLAIERAKASGKRPAKAKPAPAPAATRRPLSVAPAR